MTIARELAAFIKTSAAVPPPAIEHAKLALLDLAAAAVAGSGTRVAEVSRRAALRIWGGGAAPVWFSADRLTAPGAALANSASASALDLDDGHRAASGHPGAAIIPAVLATAAVHGCKPEKLLPAIVLGYEIAVRAAAARDFSALTTLVSGPWVGYGVVAAAAWLRDLPVETVEQALAIAGATAPNLSAIAYSKVMGNHIKEGIPWATASALAAVDFAVEGFTGPTDLLDNAAIFDRSTLLNGLGLNGLGLNGLGLNGLNDDWAIRGIYFKPYGCCRWAHSAIDAILALRAECDLSVDAIQSIEIDTFSWALRLNNEVEPKTEESAQYSLPFCVALAMTKGADALIEIGAADLRDGETTALAGKVVLAVDPAYDTMFPRQIPTRLRIVTAKGIFTREVIEPLGEPTNPMNWNRLLHKFASVAARRLSESHFQAFLSAFDDLGEGRPAGVVACLGRPLARAINPD